MRGLLEEHDNILRAYRKKKEQEKTYHDIGALDNERAASFYADGIAFVYTQIFQTDIDNAKYIGCYESTKTNPFGIWKQE